MNNSRQFGKNVFIFCWEDAKLAVYFAAILTFGFYLSAVPVKFALIIRIANRPGFGAGTAIFEGRYALRKANRRERGEKKHLPWGQIGTKLKSAPPALQAARSILKYIRLEEVHAQGRIGLPDAAQTALACGFASALEGALAARLGPGAVRFALDPDFSGGGSELVLWCMFSVSAGHIILGALNGAREIVTDFIARRVPQWTSIPLKIS